MSALDLYQGRILELASDLPEGGLLDPGSHDRFGRAHRVSRLCGSEVTVDISLDPEGRVAALGLEVQACLLGQASAAVLAADAVGASLQDLRDALNTLRTMLKADGQPPSQGGRFWELRHLAGVKDYPQRHGSVMLAFQAAVAAAEIAAEGLPSPPIPVDEPASQ